MSAHNSTPAGKVAVRGRTANQTPALPRPLARELEAAEAETAADDAR
jgi:hypothetical protein